MLDIPIHSIEETEGERRDVLQRIKDTYGFVPNLLGGLAESPASARAYLELGAEVSKTSFSAEERTVVWFAVITANECHYCIPAHTAQAIADKIDASVLSSARSGGGYSNPRLNALHDFVRGLVDSRGRPGGAALSAFVEAGFTPQQGLECVLIVAQKTLSNYANALIGTPVDTQFGAYERVDDNEGDGTATYRAIPGAT